MSLSSSVASRGYHLLKSIGTVAEFRALAQSIGRIRDETTVGIDASKTTYLCGTDAVPLHTDHPDVDLVCWYCQKQDHADGANVLLDGSLLLSQVGMETRAALAKTYLPFRPLGGGPLDLAPVLRHDGIFFAPWLRPIGRGGAFEQFRAAVAERVASGDTIRLRLERGDGLIVDNQRILHGRDRIGAMSLRRLKRFWLTTSRHNAPAKPLDDDGG